MMLTAARVRSILHYDKETGILTWIAGQRRGMRAGGPHIRGYRVITVDGKRYYEHRVCWLHVTGEWPPDDLDHEDVDGANNRWTNLRPATDRINKGNCRTYSNNMLGLKGVQLRKSGRYRVRIRDHGKLVNLGHYATEAEASAAYAAAAARVFGEYARTA